MSLVNGVPIAATVMAMLEIYKRRYELTPATEERVAQLVAPRSDPTAEPVDAAQEVTTSPSADAEGEAPPRDEPAG